MQQIHYEPFTHSQPRPGWFYCLEDGCVTTKACESWDTQCPAKYWLSLCCHMSLTSLLRWQGPPRPPPFPFQADTPMTCFYKWALEAHTLPGSYANRECLTRYLAIEHNLHQNAKELLFYVPSLLPRWCHSSFNFCKLIPDVIWTFPYFFSFVPAKLQYSCLPNFCQLPTFTIYSDLPVLWIHDPMLFTVASPGLANSLSISSILHSEPCFRFPSSSFFSAILSPRDSIQGGKNTHTIKWVGGRNPSREEGKQAKYTFQIFLLLVYIYKIHFSKSSLH